MRTSLFLILGLALTGCNASGGLAGIGSSSTADNTPDDGVDPTDPHNGETDTPAPATFPTAGDQDGDGIPDADDYIPCMAFYVKLWNQQVSSASVNLNEQEVVDQSFFPTDAVIVEFINPVPGSNQIDFGGRVTGSPEDELHIEIWSTAGSLFLHHTLIREDGSPEAVLLEFSVNVYCS